jgi:hypothetical protein
MWGHSQYIKWVHLICKNSQLHARKICMRAAVVRCVFVHQTNAPTMVIRIANAVSMFYSVPLTMIADAVLFELGVRQLAARIPFECVAQREALKTLRH